MEVDGIQCMLEIVDTTSRVSYEPCIASFKAMCTHACMCSISIALNSAWNTEPQVFILQEEFSAMRDLYMKNAQGFVLVYSITSQSTFDDLSVHREQILRVKDHDTVSWCQGHT